MTIFLQLQGLATDSRLPADSYEADCSSEIWNNDSGSDLGDTDSDEEFQIHHDTVTGVPSGHSEQNTLLQKLVFFVMMWKSLFRLSSMAVSVLMKFLREFLRILGKAFNCQILLDFSSSIPVSMIKCENFLKLNYGFKKYVVCPKCASLYNFHDCILAVRGKRESKKCHHVFFPSKTKECKGILLKTLLSNRLQKFVPFKQYAYKSLRESIKALAKKENFVDDCEKWRSRNTSPDTYGDIYDGDVWNGFSDFLKEPHHYLLMLNVDWFQPFSHIQYSVGAIYLVIQNLPRHKRFLEENIILVGVIPRPSEPKLTMNSYLAPLTLELREGWENGFVVKTNRDININVKVALSSVVCDIPASRKVSGFLSHNAKLGCNKCYKDFSAQSSIDSSYTKRTKQLHLEHLKQMEGVENMTQLRDVEKKYGVRFSILTTLPYFDPVKFTVIDPMHNLYLGTAKHVLKFDWISTEWSFLPIRVCGYCHLAKTK